jgi:hypothetical protein
MNNGLRIFKRRRAVDLELARQYLEVLVANVSDCMARMTSGGPRLRPMHAGGRMAGPALTIKARPGDNLMIHKALQLANLATSSWSTQAGILVCHISCFVMAAELRAHPSDSALHLADVCVLTFPGGTSPRLSSGLSAQFVV